MSFDRVRLLESLEGKTTTFVVEGRPTNLALAKLLLSGAPRRGGCQVLDLDGFYASNAEALLGGSPAEAQRSAVFDVPDPSAPLAPHLGNLFSCGRRLLVIDSLNTLNHLLTEARGLSFVEAALGAYARANRSAAVLSMYRRDGPPRGGKGTTIASYSDVEIHARVEDGRLLMETRRGALLPEKTMTFEAT